VGSGSPRGQYWAAVDIVHRDRVFCGRRQLRASEFASAASSLNHAIGLWRGLPGTDLPQTGRLSAMLAALRAELMTAAEHKCRAAILSGQHSEAIADLEWHVASYPTYESAWAQLACAHYLNGNAAVAQSAVRRAYQMIGTQVGLAPSAALKAAEEAAVRHYDEWFRSYLTR
jgi:DNA-binding SARP family transcriptional activator